MPVINHLALEAWLERAVEGFRGPFDCRRFSRGVSNPTYVLTTPERRYVLRKTPRGAPPSCAHAIEREYRVMRALEGAGVPVPRMLAQCQDAGVIGAPFFVMAHVEGRIFWRPTLPALSFEERAAIYDDMNRVIAKLHQIDPAAVALADYGEPRGYLERQITRWSKQYLMSRNEPIDAMDRLVAWLPKRLPAVGATAIVHGDLRLDNMIFHPTEPRLVALIDWQLSTLGDPLADFGGHMLAWVLREEDCRGMVGEDLAALGIPGAEDYFRLYANRRGLGAIDPELWDYHLVYNLFRLASIMQSHAKRAEDGNASSQEAFEIGAKAGPIAELAWRTACERFGAA